MRAEPTETINETMQETIMTGRYPSGIDTETELRGVETTLTEAGVDVLRPDVLTDAPLVSDQTCPRDLGFIQELLPSKNDLPNLSRVVVLPPFRQP